MARNEMAATLINQLVATMDEYQRSGIGAFLPAWREYDALIDQPVRLMLGQQTVEGIARGVDESGALLLEQADGRHRYMAGEVTLHNMN